MGPVELVTHQMNRPGIGSWVVGAFEPLDHAWAIVRAYVVRVTIIIDVKNFTVNEGAASQGDRGPIGRNVKTCDAHVGHDIEEPVPGEICGDGRSWVATVAHGMLLPAGVVGPGLERHRDQQDR